MENEAIFESINLQPTFVRHVLMLLTVNSIGAKSFMPCVPFGGVFVTRVSASTNTLLNVYAVPHSRRSGAAQSTHILFTAPCHNRRARNQLHDAHDGAKVTVMLCRQLSRAVRRDCSVAACRLRTTPCSFAKVNLFRLPIRPKGKIDGDALQELDIDAIEAQSKNWFGDHSTWSHEKLLNLMVCKLRLFKD